MNSPFCYFTGEDIKKRKNSMVYYSGLITLLYYLLTLVT